MSMLMMGCGAPTGEVVPAEPSFSGEVADGSIEEGGDGASPVIAIVYAGGSTLRFAIAISGHTGDVTVEFDDESGATISGNNTASVTITGTKAQIETEIASIVISAAVGSSGIATAALGIRRNGEGSDADTDSFDLEITPAEPSFTGIPPDASMVEGGALDAIGIGIDYAGAEDLFADLGLDTPGLGVLSVPDSTGAIVTGNGTQAVTIEGTKAQVAGELAGLEVVVASGAGVVNLGLGIGFPSEDPTDGGDFDIVVAPLAPDLLTSDPGVDPLTQVDLEWSDNSGGEAGYEIRQNAGLDDFPSAVMVSDLGANVESETMGGLEPGTNYFFYVAAFIVVDMERVYSDWVTTEQETDPAPLNEIHQFTTGGATEGTVSLGGAPPVPIDCSDLPAALAPVWAACYGGTEGDYTVTGEGETYHIEFTGAGAGMDQSDPALENNTTNGFPEVSVFQQGG